MSFVNEDELLLKRFRELARKSTNHGYYVFTDFLSLAEQSLLNKARSSFERGTHCILFGGFDGAERVMARFGDPEELGFEESFPISIIKAEPKSMKFADKLSHRDFLGSLMNLGIERSTLGDIVIIDNIGYIFAKAEMCDYICDSLSKVKHTDIKCSVSKVLPEGTLLKKEVIKIQLSGERIDAAIAKVYGLSRDDSLSLFKKRLVFVSGRECENNSYTPTAGDIISVRGYGRFIYKGAFGTSKKGKLNVEIEKFI